MKGIFTLLLFSLSISISYSQIDTNKIEISGKDTVKHLNRYDSLYLNKKVIVLTINNNEIRGIFIGNDSLSIYLSQESGELKILKSKIVSIKKDEYEGDFPFPNAHDTRYFFGPTAIPIKKGHGYYQNIMVLGHFVNVGITKNLSIGGGFEFISLFLRQPIVFLTPKVGFKLTNKVHMGGGLLFVHAFESNFGIAYAAGTIGSSETNVSLGVGYGFSNGEANKLPTFMISGQHRVSKVVSLMTENYIISTSNEVVVFGIQGVRLLTEKSAFDIGLGIYPEIIKSGIPIPFIGYTRVFGRK